MFLADAIEYQARTRPHAAALIYGQRVLRYGDFIAVVRRMAAVFAERGLRQGDVVGITMANSPMHLVTLIALARLGAVSVALHPYLPRPSKQAVVAEYGVSAVVSNQPDAEVDGIPWIVVDNAWLETGKSVAAWRRSGEQGDLPWRIALSSGTTGTPKGVLHTQAQTLNLTLLQRTVIDIGANARFLVLMDLNATANVMRILRHLLAGSAIVFPRTVRVTDSVFEAIDRHGVTHTLVSPDIVSRWIVDLPAGQVRAPGLEHLAVAGGRVSASLRRAIIEKVSPNLYINYGTTETGMVAVADPATHQRHPEGVGRVVPWARAQIVDENDRPVTGGQPGIVRFRSIGASDGYHRNPAASAKNFRDGWVYPGDTGRLLPDGVLVIESRIDDIINVGGAKIDPAGIEDALAEHPGVVEAAVFGAKGNDGRERLYAAVVLRSAVDEQVLIQHCIDRVGRHAPRRIIPVRELPRNQMGKIVRHELAQQVRAQVRAGGAAAAAGS